MRVLFSLAIVASSLGACATDRLVREADHLGTHLNELPVREVLKNLSAGVVTPDRIPSRTTFGQSSLNFSDSRGLAGDLPLFGTVRGSGSLSIKPGDMSDQLIVSIVPEKRADALRALRDLYREALYPESHPYPSTNFGKIYRNRWLFWVTKMGSKDNDPVIDRKVFHVGSTEYHDFYAKDRETFSEFVLSSFGSQPTLAVDRARSRFEKPRIKQTTAQPPQERTRPSTRGGTIPERPDTFMPFTVVPAPPAR